MVRRSCVCVCVCVCLCQQRMDKRACACERQQVCKLAAHKAAHNAALFCALALLLRLLEVCRFSFSFPVLFVIAAVHSILFYLLFLNSSIPR